MLQLANFCTNVLPKCSTQQHQPNTLEHVLTPSVCAEERQNPIEEVDQGGRSQIITEFDPGLLHVATRQSCI